MILMTTDYGNTWTQNADNYAIGGSFAGEEAQAIISVFDNEDVRVLKNRFGARGSLYVLLCDLHNAEVQMWELSVDN